MIEGAVKRSCHEPTGHRNACERWVRRPLDLDMDDLAAEYSSDPQVKPISDVREREIERERERERE